MLNSTAASTGLRWTTLSTATNVVTTLLLTGVMARLLEPRDFGLIALAQLVLRFVSYFAQAGVVPAIIQKKNLDAADVLSAISVSVGMAFGLYLIVFLIAPFASHFSGNVELPTVIRLLAVTFLISSLSSVPVGLLRRSLKYKQMAAAETVSFVIGYSGVGLVLAWFNFGVWSLVFAAIGQECLMLIISASLTFRTWCVVERPTEVRYFLGFGGKYSLIGLLEFLGTSIDSLLVGKLFGDASLGLYNRSQMLCKLPAHHISTIVQKVYLPILSANQSNKAALAGAYLSGLSAVGLATAFSAATAAALNEELVGVLLGSKWIESAELIPAIAMGIPASFLVVISGILCDAQGMLREKLKIQSASLLVLVGLLATFSGYGIKGLAIAVSISEIIRLIFYVLMHARNLNLNPLVLPKILGAVSIAGVVYGLAGSLFAQYFRSLGYGLYVRTLILSPILVLLLLAALFAVWLMLRSCTEVPLVRGVSRKLDDLLRR